MFFSRAIRTLSRSAGGANFRFMIVYAALVTCAL